MTAKTSLKRYGYIIIESYRYEFGNWEYHHCIAKTEEEADKILHTDECGFWEREIVSKSEAKLHGWRECQ